MWHGIKRSLYICMGFLSRSLVISNIEHGTIIWGLPHQDMFSWMSERCPLSNGSSVHTDEILTASSPRANSTSMYMYSHLGEITVSATTGLRFTNYCQIWFFIKFHWSNRSFTAKTCCSGIGTRRISRPIILFNETKRKRWIHPSKSARLLKEASLIYLVV